MDNFVKVAAGVIISLIVYLILKNQGNGFSAIISILTCSMVLIVATTYWETILDFVANLKDLGNLNSNLLEILLKVTGIALLTEVTSAICSDAGSSSMGKSLQILASVVIVWLAIPLFASLIDLIEEILMAI